MATIDSVVTQRVLVPIRKEWMVRGGRGSHDRSPFLIVRVRSEGIEGLGEVSGTYGWSGEGFETAEAAIRTVLADYTGMIPVDPVEVQVGGATIFVFDVERFERL